MRKQEIIFLNSVFFVLGFTVVFSVVGILFQTLLAHTGHTVMGWLTIVGGIIIIGFGILMVASAKYVIPFFSAEHKIKVRRLGNNYISSFVFGLAFALGWTPCVGAILGSIYALAASEPGLSFLLLMAYSLGLGIPFLIFGAFISKLSTFLEHIKGFLKYFSVISGVFLIALGALVVTGYIGLLAIFLIGSNGVLTVGDQLNFVFALLAGILTFLSPCILPLLPAYLSYMAGTAVDEAKT